MSLDEDRVRFYLRNRERIEEWAALRSEAAIAIDEWLASLRPDVEELAKELGSDVGVYAALSDDNTYPKFFLTRNSWPGVADEDPPAAIALEWIRGRTTMGPSHVPYVGLRCPRAGSLGLVLRDSEPLRRARIERKDATTAWWIGWAYVPPGPSFPESRDEYRAALIDALRHAWGAYAPLVDAVVCSGQRSG